MKLWAATSGLFGGAAILAACHTQPAAYTRALAQADRARESEDYLTCGSAYAQASQATDSSEAASEALFRAATCYRRANETAQYLSLLQKLASQPGPRQERASYDLVFYQLEQTANLKPGNSAPDFEALEPLLARFPNAPSARRGLRTWIEGLLARFGAAQTLVRLDRLLPKLKSSRCEEQARFERAVLVQHSGDLRAARQQFDVLAQEFPYPTGDFWEAATQRSVALSLRLSEPATAIASLEQFLSHREPALLNGSYERGYGRAHFQLATLYAQLGHTDRAYTEYIKLAEAYPTSLYRDDAAWFAARLAHEKGDTSRACAAARTLTQNAPDSAYVPCLPQLCASARATGNCHEYLLKRPPELGISEQF